MNVSSLPELSDLEALLSKYSKHLSVDCLAQIGSMAYPLYLVKLASSLGGSLPTRRGPAVCFVGGVHGVERIGTQVVLAFLKSLLQRMEWDVSLLQLIATVDVYFIPLVNPEGMAKQWRANGAGVDLMRNAPINATSRVIPLVGGQRISSRLPWYRGVEGGAMQLESQAVLEVAKNHLFGRPLSLVLDCHSGFGQRDRLWFPYAYSKTKPFKFIGEVTRLRELFFRCYPHQAYVFEPQSLHYCSHGDLWDYVMQCHYAQPYHHCLLPITLEMGSWRWLKKNPLQLFSTLGLYHPVKPHRVERVLRRHLVLMEFLLRAGASYSHWLSAEDKARCERWAVKKWYD